MTSMDMSIGTVSGHLFFWCDSRDLANNLDEIARECGMSSLSTDSQSVMQFKVPDISLLPEAVNARTNILDQRKVNILFTETEKPGLEAFGEVRSLERFCQEISSRWLLELLSEHRLKSLMQPIVTASEKARVVGYEFLMRGLQKDGTEIPAPVMLQAGGDAGASFLLDLAAGETAVKTAKQFDVQEKIFVNVMPETLMVPDGVEAWLNAVMPDEKVPASRFVFEMVESEFFDDQAVLAELGEKVKEAGIGLALDGFGTGSNSYNLLEALKPDYVKLDARVHVDLADDARRWHNLANIVDAAKQEDVKVIATGVEDETTAAALRMTGVDYLQGYLFGYPKDGPVQS